MLLIAHQPEPRMIDMMPFEKTTLIMGLIALQAAAFGWRIQREIPLGDEGRKQWLPLTDWLNAVSLLAVVTLCIVIPVYTGQFGRDSTTVLVAASVLFAY